jgi:hypothetical protein
LPKSALFGLLLVADAAAAEAVEETAAWTNGDTAALLGTAMSDAVRRVVGSDEAVWSTDAAVLVEDKVTNVVCELGCKFHGRLPGRPHGSA